MVSGPGTPEVIPTSGSVASAADKKQWIRPVVHAIALESAENTRAHPSPDATHTSRF